MPQGTNLGGASSDEDRAATPTGPSPEEVSGIAGIPCAECERLREEIADYMGHRTDNIAGKLWAAQHLFSRFTSRLWELLGEPDKFDTGTDDYDASLEIYHAPEDARLNEEAQRLICDAGFGKVYLNHNRGKRESDTGKWQTHYAFYCNGKPYELPVRGWRRRYVADPAVDTTRVIAGPEENGYYEISSWPEGWDDQRSKAGLERGYYRIVPDPLDPITADAAQ